MDNNSDDATKFAAAILKNMVSNKETKTPIKKYERGYPCMLGEVVGRIVGESDEGSWGQINGLPFYSVPLFSSPHGTIVKTGVLHLTEITEEGMKKLIGFEEDVKSKGEQLYGGKL